MLEIIFGITFSILEEILLIQNLNITNMKKKTVKEFLFKNKESVNTYCVKHCIIENIQKKKHLSNNDWKKPNLKLHHTVQKKIICQKTISIQKIIIKIVEN